MDVRWAGRGVNALVCEKLGELLGEKLTGVVAVECTHNACGRVASFKVHCLEPSMVVYYHEGVSSSTIYRRKEGASDVDVDETARMRGLVQAIRMR
eukprot:5683655-Pleurochrysis_carterae.AAC.3